MVMLFSVSSACQLANPVRSVLRHGARTVADPVTSAADGGFIKVGIGMPYTLLEVKG